MEIPLYEWLYTIDELSTVRSLKSWKIIKASLNKWYLKVNLSKNWKVKCRAVSRLMASVFYWLDLNNPKQLACHKDDNPLNNRKENIFVWTQKDNIQDQIMKWRSRWTEREICQYTKNNNFIRAWNSANKFYQSIWKTKGHIWECCKWKRDSYMGYIWRYSKHSQWEV